MRKIIHEIKIRSSLRKGKETIRFFFQKIKKSDPLNELCIAIAEGSSDCGIFNGVPQLVRTNPYFRKEKREEILQNCNGRYNSNSLNETTCLNCPIGTRKVVSRNWEVRFCCRQFVKHHNNKDFISMDFQTPLKVHNDDESLDVGEIDYIFAKGNDLWLCEAKVDDNTSDSLVKTIIEIETYWRILNPDGISKMLSEYNSYYSLELSSVKKAIVVYRSWWNSEIEKYTAARLLLEKWNIDVFEAEGLENKKLIRI